MKPSNFPMSDLHTHLLWGVDDGAESMAVAEKMLLDASKQGIKCIYATSHSHFRRSALERELYERRFLELRALGERVAPEITLMRGMELSYTPNTAGALAAGTLLPLGNTNYALIELWDRVSWQEVREAAGAILRAGFLPVLAHVERYRCFVSSPKRALALRRELPVCYQFDASFALEDRSLLEHRFFTRMLQERGFDFMASDAHDASRRPNRLREAYRFLIDYIDRDYLHSLVSFPPD